MSPGHDVRPATAEAPVCGNCVATVLCVGDRSCIPDAGSTGQTGGGTGEGAEQNSAMELTMFVPSRFLFNPRQTKPESVRRFRTRDLAADNMGGSRRPTRSARLPNPVPTKDGSATSAVAGHNRRNPAQPRHCGEHRKQPLFRLKDGGPR